MKLSKTARRALAFLIFWGGVALLVSLIYTFPKIVASLIPVSCVVMLVITSWQLVTAYIDE